MDLVLAPHPDGADRYVGATSDGGATGAVPELRVGAVTAWLRDHPECRRVVWADSAACYPPLLRAGHRLDRVVDLRLTRAILRRAERLDHTPYVAAPESVWDTPVVPAGEEGPTLFDDGPDITGALSLADVVAEHHDQQRALAAAGDGGRLALLCHAESVGALIAQELNHVGLPFDTAVHDQLLTELLGPPGLLGGRPARLEELCGRIREALAAPSLNPDSPTDVIAVLRRRGLEVTSTRQWELERIDHPVIAPLLEYKKLSRLHTANGWSWMRSWIADGRFRSDWVAGGVVTGRWASRGGGALQLPRQIRAAVRAVPGHRLVVADAALLEPRVLAAMARDRALAAACRGTDLYQGLVDQGVTDTRQHAKIGVLAAMYGGTSGEAGAVLPRLARAYPDAIGLVEAAARAGERGGRVSTWLGRTSPWPSSWWHDAQTDAQLPEAGPDAVLKARRAARDQGRFTRNFVVQGTAAEWALCWLGHLRRALAAIDPGEAGPIELVYFLHDEVIVHCPDATTDAVAAAITRAADDAGRVLFGDVGVEFAVTTAVVDAYDRAK